MNEDEVRKIVREVINEQNNKEPEIVDDSSTTMLKALKVLLRNTKPLPAYICEINESCESCKNLKRWIEVEIIHEQFFYEGIRRDVEKVQKIIENTKDKEEIFKALMGFFNLMDWKSEVRKNGVIVLPGGRLFMMSSKGYVPIDEHKYYSLSKK